MDCNTIYSGCYLFVVHKLSLLYKTLLFKTYRTIGSLLPSWFYFVMRKKINISTCFMIKSGKTIIDSKLKGKDEAVCTKSLAPISTYVQRLQKMLEHFSIQPKCGDGIGTFTNIIILVPSIIIIYNNDKI